MTSQPNAGRPNLGRPNLGRPIPGRQAGFTLLEVLAALALFSLLLLVLGQGMQFGQRAWRGQARALSWPDEMEALDRTLRQMITRAVSVDESKAVDGNKPDGSGQIGPLVGGPAVMDVVTRMAQPGSVFPTPTEMRLEVDTAHRLVVRMLQHAHVRWITPPAQQLVVLAERVDRVEFAYWQLTPAGGAWVRDWPGPALPVLVRIRLRFPSGDLRHWPDIVAAPATRALSASAAPLAPASAAPLAPVSAAPLARDSIGSAYVG